MRVLLAERLEGERVRHEKEIREYLDMMKVHGAG